MSVNEGGKPPDPQKNQQVDNTVSYSDDEEMGFVGFNTNRSPQIGTEHVSKNINLIETHQNKTLQKEEQHRGKNVNTQKEIFKYGPNDLGPFHIYVENKQSNFKGRINALKVGDIILTNYPELDNKITSIDTIGRNRIRIKIKDFKYANYLIEHKNDKIFENNNLEIYIPKFIVVRQGVIRGIDNEFTDEYIKNKIKKYDMHCNFEVLNVKRINRKIINEGKVEFVPTKSCIVSFKSQTLPKYVTINKVLKEVDPYRQKVLLCFNCLRYGHLGNQCNSKSRCNNCHQQHNTKDCKETQIIPKCFSCMGDHLTTNLYACPEFKRQKLIKETMSLTNMNYYDANKQIPKNSYASVVASNRPESISTIEQNSNLPIPSTNLPNSKGSSNNKSNTNFNYSQISQNKKTFMQHMQNTNNTTKVNGSKRLRPSSPDPIVIAHREIISQYRNDNISSTGILNNQIYQKNLPPRDEFQMSEIDYNSVILKCVTEILKKLRESNNFNISENDLEKIISTQLNINETNLASESQWRV